MNQPPRQKKSPVKRTAKITDRSPVKGPRALIECSEEIPCDPCAKACSKGAIRIEGPITSLPVFDSDRCDGCGLCIPSCPGLAIFVIDPSFSGKEGLIKLPYEFLPLPRKGDRVIVLDREGKEIGIGKVHQVLNPSRFDRTPVVSLLVPKGIVSEVRHFRPQGKK